MKTKITDSNESLKYALKAYRFSLAAKHLDGESEYVQNLVGSLASLFGDSGYIFGDAGVVINDVIKNLTE